jgi:hypothetical protein
MFICAAGDIHGAMDRLYDDVFAFESLLGIRFDYVLHVGDFGIWPDASQTLRECTSCVVRLTERRSKCAHDGSRR